MEHLGWIKMNFCSYVWAEKWRSGALLLQHVEALGTMTLKGGLNSKYLIKPRFGEEWKNERRFSFYLGRDFILETRPRVFYFANVIRLLKLINHEFKGGEIFGGPKVHLSEECSDILFWSLVILARGNFSVRFAALVKNASKKSNKDFTF